jgi:hypothetical protein
MGCVERGICGREIVDVKEGERERLGLKLGLKLSLNLGLGLGLVFRLPLRLDMTSLQGTGYG